MNRVRSVDVLRGFALMCMVLVHFIIYFGDSTAMRSWLYFALNHLLADWGAAGFLMMMGISQVLSAAKTPDASEWFLFKKAIVRTLYLIALGLLLSTLAFGPWRMFEWDILPVMGFATLVLYFCRFLPSWLLVVLMVIMALITPWLRSLIDPIPIWGEAFMATPVISDYLPGLYVDPTGDLPVIWRLDAIAQGFLLTGYFPIFPWLIFPLMGFLMGRRMVAQRFRQDLLALVAFGLLLLILGLGAALASTRIPGASAVTGYLAPLSFYPDSFTMVLLQLSVSLVVFSALYYWYDVRRGQQAKVGFVTNLYNRTSRFALTFYFAHYLLIGWTLLIVYLVTGQYRIFDLMGAWPALLCGLVALALLETMLAVWERKGGRFSLEWILAWLTAWIAPPAHASAHRLSAHRT
ncbi:MAG: DUF1624 domain-containing protein [Anaerolineales bacterium]|nr:DUF1624 domain-containing protein [Anaerolineales bacterium]